MDVFGGLDAVQRLQLVNRQPGPVAFAQSRLQHVGKLVFAKQHQMQRRPAVGQQALHQPQAARAQLVGIVDQEQDRFPIAVQIDGVFAERVETTAGPARRVDPQFPQDGAEQLRVGGEQIDRHQRRQLVDWGAFTKTGRQPRFAAAGWPDHRV